MRELAGILGALTLVRLFWTGVFKWHDFYDMCRHAGRDKDELPQSPTWRTGSSENDLSSTTTDFRAN